jgi:hypothetical protein
MASPELGRHLPIVVSSGTGERAYVVPFVGECRGVVLRACLSGQYGESVGESPPAPGSIPGKSTPLTTPVGTE